MKILDKNILEEILIINGFKKYRGMYIRDDGINIEINSDNKEYCDLVYWDGTCVIFKSEYELIGYLVLKRIISRIF